MTWTQRLLIAQMGTIFGILSLVSFIAGLEYYFFFALMLAAGLLAAWLAREKFFKEGFILGFFTWWFAILVQGIFIGVYLENNPQYQDLAQDLPLGVQALTLLGGSAAAVGFGVMSGGIATLANLVRLRFSR
ncbi:MAG: hypothetical protein V3R20_04665 [Sphingomonadales bacterium]